MMSTTSLESVGPRRLEPEQRRTQLLETAKGIIEREGIGACTIDLVSTEAGVTAQLVHKYFGTRSSLLQTLYAREEAEYEKEIERRLSASRNFEDIVRVFVTANLDLLSPTTAIGQLRSMPEIIPTQTSRDSANRASARRALVRGFRWHLRFDSVRRLRSKQPRSPPSTTTWTALLTSSEQSTSFSPGSGPCSTVRNPDPETDCL